MEWKGALLSMQNIDKGLYEAFKAVANEILQVYQFGVNLDQKFPISFHNLETLQK